jgi:hypothetical protein
MDKAQRENGADRNDKIRRKLVPWIIGIILVAVLLIITTMKPDSQAELGETIEKVIPLEMTREHGFSVYKVTEEYWDSVNIYLTKEVLEDSELVGNIVPFGTSAGSPDASLSAAIDGVVTEISGRTLTLANTSGSTLQIYIGCNVKISMRVGLDRKLSSFSEIEIGDIVGLSGSIRYGSNEPFLPDYLSITRNEW